MMFKLPDLKLVMRTMAGLDAVLAADGAPPPPGMMHRWRPSGVSTWKNGDKFQVLPIVVG